MLPPSVHKVTPTVPDALRWAAELLTDQAAMLRRAAEVQLAQAEVLEERARGIDVEAHRVEQRERTAPPPEEADHG